LERADIKGASWALFSVKPITVPVKSCRNIFIQTLMFASSWKGVFLKIAGMERQNWLPVPWYFGPQRNATPTDLGPIPDVLTWNSGLVLLSTLFFPLPPFKPGLKKPALLLAEFTAFSDRRIGQP